MSNETISAIGAPAADEESMVVKFGKPYKFEGKEYTEVDLSGLEDLSAEDMISADKYLSKNGSFSVVPEMALEYACFIAAKCSGQPIEFYRQLPAKEAIKVKNKVTGFFYGED
jgi:hypothetical protein